MTWGQWFILAMTVQCAGAVVAFIYERNYGMATAFVGYTVANIGLLHATH